MSHSDPDQASPPPAILTWGAAKLESRVPRLVRGFRRARDQSVIWRDSFAYRHYPEPGRPFGARYLRNHRRFLAASLADSDLIECFRDNVSLPPGYGVGFDERVVELPWLLSRSPNGRALDAGSSLNHGHVLDHVLPLVDALYSCTLAPEPHSFNDRGVSYVYADLRELPFRDGWFDTVVSVSTLEHVGMDVERWGARTAPAPDPRSAVHAAVDELRRVTRPGGRLLLTVPYGRREDHGWLRQFDHEDISQLASVAAPNGSDIAVFAYDRRGWRRSTLEDAAGARYQKGNRPADDPATEDLAPAARAVACIDATV
jgi:SAM-dependent methyltransferase